MFLDPVSLTVGMSVSYVLMCRIALEPFGGFSSACRDTSLGCASELI